MAVATLETSLYQGEIVLADRAGKGTSSSKALKFWFEVCIHSVSLPEENFESNCVIRKNKVNCFHRNIIGY